MMYRLLISTSSASGPTNGATADQRNAITEALRAKGWEVWHWFEDLWLVTFNSDQVPELTPLREELKSLIGEKYVLIMDLPEGITFSGYGNKEGWPWMYSHWGTPRS